MSWTSGRRSDNVEERRGVLQLSGNRGGLLALVVALGAMYFGMNPALLNTLLGTGTSLTRSLPVASTRAGNCRADMGSVVHADAEDSRYGLFTAAGGSSSRESQLVLLRGATQSASLQWECGDGAIPFPHGSQGIH